jgi:hypothetical protein
MELVPIATKILGDKLLPMEREIDSTQPLLLGILKLSLLICREIHIFSDFCSITEVPLQQINSTFSACI